MSIKADQVVEVWQCPCGWTYESPIRVIQAGCPRPHTARVAAPKRIWSKDEEKT